MTSEASLEPPASCSLAVSFSLLASKPHVDLLVDREHRNSRESSGLNLSSPAKRLRRDDGPTETAGDEGEATKMSGDERWKLALTEQEDAEALQAQSDGHVRLLLPLWRMRRLNRRDRTIRPRDGEEEVSMLDD